MEDGKIEKNNNYNEWTASRNDDERNEVLKMFRNLIHII